MTRTTKRNEFVPVLNDPGKFVYEFCLWNFWTMEKKFDSFNLKGKESKMSPKLFYFAKKRTFSFEICIVYLLSCLLMQLYNCIYCITSFKAPGFYFQNEFLTPDYRMQPCKKLFLAWFHWDWGFIQEWALMKLIQYLWISNFDLFLHKRLHFLLLSFYTSMAKTRVHKVQL